MGRGLAIALESAGIAVDEGRSREVSVVWTGPAAGVPVLRLTRAVVEEVIGAAGRLLVISFAAYRVPVVVDALVAATDHGVQLDLVLETAADSSGMLAFDSLAVLPQDVPNATDRRPVAESCASGVVVVVEPVWQGARRDGLSGSAARAHSRLRVCCSAPPCRWFGVGRVVRRGRSPLG